jgi:hypothetical protein
MLTFLVNSHHTVQWSRRQADIGFVKIIDFMVDMALFNIQMNKTKKNFPISKNIGVFWIMYHYTVLHFGADYRLSSCSRRGQVGTATTSRWNDARAARTTVFIWESQFFWLLWRGFGNLNGHQQHKRLRTFLNTGVKACSILSSSKQLKGVPLNLLIFI